MNHQRIAQFNKLRQREKPQASSILKHSALRSVSQASVQRKEDTESLAFSNSPLHQDFSQVPISTTKPQQIMAKLMIGPVGDKYEQEADRVAAQVVQRSPRLPQKLPQPLVTTTPSASTSDRAIQEKGDITGNDQGAFEEPRGNTTYQSCTISNNIETKKASIPTPKEHVLQAKFVENNKILTQNEVETWYSKISDGSIIPRERQEILAILVAAENELIEINEFNSAKKFSDYLKKRESDYRQRMIVNGKEIVIPGTLSVERPGSYENWGLGQHQPHAVPSDLNAEAATELAHVTYDAKKLDHKMISTTYGSNPGEFGHGFYLTTGHEMMPQEAVSMQWGNPTIGDFPRDIVRFRIANTTLGQIVNNNPQHLAFLIYMLQFSSGYPAHMSEADAITLMNQINTKQKVLIFPDNKDQPILIAENQFMTWTQYTQHNTGNSDHYLVIGPQRPLTLAGIRQIAVRGELGNYFINIAKRSYQKLAAS
ncbi:MAG TPA: hypothetical protein V6C85_30975 [Allocoleopsis sp.]